MRRPPAWLAYLALGALLTAAYVLLPPFRGSGPVMNLLGLSPVLAIAAGVWLYRPRSVAPWGWFAVGFVLFWFGDLYTYSYPLLLDRDVPFPSPGDAAYVLVYPVLMAGLLLLIRRRSDHGDRGGVIDGLILTVGLSLPQWIALMAPYLHDNELSTVAKLVSIAYPLGDVLLLAAAIRLSLDVGWIGFYLLWGAAALHPSMAQLEQRSVRRDSMLTRFRLALLTCASLVAPVISLVHDIQRRDIDMAVVTGASIALFGLVVVRMAGLVRQQERSLARERMLSSAGAALVGAASRAEIHEVAVGSARALAGAASTALLCSDGEGDRLELLAAAGDDAPSVAPRSLPGPDAATVVDVTPRRGAAKRLVVSAPARPAPAVDAALRALATQVALALDSIALTEEVHRRRSEARFSSLVQHSSDLITVLGPGGEIAYQSPSIERVLGYTPEEVAGRRFEELVEAGDRGRLARLVASGAADDVDHVQALECTLVHRDGETRAFEILVTNLQGDEHVGGIVLNSRDVSERKVFEQQLAHQAFHDGVTGLANRALFAERVRHAIARSRREGSGLAVIFLDLDDFKTINDSLGHAAGDEVLIEVARRLDESIRGADTAARFGGDEFAVLLEDVEHSQEAADAAERILEALAVPLVAG